MFSNPFQPPRMDSTLSSLLSLLNDKKSRKQSTLLTAFIKPRSSITSVVNATTINLIQKLLFREDYVSVAGDLTQASDAKNLLDFMLHLLRNHHLLNQDPTGVNIDQRARRFMMKVISKIPVVPPSLIVTGVLVKREVIGGGGYGLVFMGKLKGAAVALKVLYKTVDNVVSLTSGRCYKAVVQCQCLHQQAFCREALTWQFLSHKFVLLFLGIHEMASQFFLVSPYMKNGTLSQWRKKANPSIAEIEKRVRLLFLQLFVDAHIMEDATSGSRL